MENQNLVPIDYSNQRVMTSKQLADALSDRDDNGNITKAVTVNNIKNNFRNNRDQFVEGRDYFKLEGDALRNFKREVNSFDFAPNLNVLYLWTEWGAMLHAKMVNTDKAWEKYKALVQFYFHCRDAVAVPAVQAAAPVQPVPTIDMQTILDAITVIVHDTVTVALYDAIGDFNEKLTQINEKLTKVLEEMLVYRESINAQFKDTSVYVMKVSEDTVKIGVSQKPQDRFVMLNRKKDVDISDIQITPFMLRKYAYAIEKLAHEKFSKCCVEGEIFAVDFQKACDVVNDFVGKMPHWKIFEEADPLALYDGEFWLNKKSIRLKAHKKAFRLYVSKQNRHDSPYQNFLDEMEAHLLTYGDLAMILGIVESTFSLKIRGKQDFSADEKAKLVEIFRKPIEYLLKRFDPAERKNNADETADVTE